MLTSAKNSLSLAGDLVGTAGRLIAPYAASPPMMI